MTKELWIEVTDCDCLSCGHEVSLNVLYIGDKTSPEVIEITEVCPNCGHEELGSLGSYDIQWVSSRIRIYGK